MRLWHTDLIPVLPRQQLLGQWRELNSIFKKQDKHILINFVYDYPKEDLMAYSLKVMSEMQNRGYRFNASNFHSYFRGINYKHILFPFAKKMTDRYLRQCLYNLQEKYDCGGISEVEWEKINDAFRC